MSETKNYRYRERERGREHYFFNEYIFFFFFDLCMVCYCISLWNHYNTVVYSKDVRVQIVFFLFRTIYMKENLTQETESVKHMENES